MVAVGHDLKEAARIGDPVATPHPAGGVRLEGTLLACERPAGRTTDSRISKRTGSWNDTSTSR
jgi:hypothetical protein